MSRVHQAESVHRVAEEIPGYDYGEQRVAVSPITVRELEQLEKSAGFTAADHGWLRVAGEVLADQSTQLVEKWRKVIEEHPEPGALRAAFKRGARRALFGGQRAAFSAVGFGHLLQAVRSGLAELPAGDRVAPHQRKEKQDRRRRIRPTIQLRDVVAFAAVIKRFAHHQAFSGSERSWPRGRGQNAPGLVQIGVDAGCLVDATVHRPRAGGRRIVVAEKPCAENLCQ